ncbi:MAG: peptidase M15, partial [Rhizobiaceae bacterium]|nr:peptidase M15 [Rhizobiaceae bacterium]
SLPTTGPVVQNQRDVASIGGIPGKPVDAAALLPQAPTVAPAPSTAPRVASLSTEAGPAQATVKTTTKGSKPGRRDKRPQPKPVVVSAQPAAARWAFDNNYVAQRTAGTKAPSLAYNIVRTAPREVYTAGFSAGEQTVAANKFTGNAVTFLSVARFETN